MVLGWPRGGSKLFQITCEALEEYLHTTFSVPNEQARRWDTLERLGIAYEHPPVVRACSTASSSLHLSQAQSKANVLSSSAFLLHVPCRGYYSGSSSAIINYRTGVLMHAYAHL